MEAGNMTDEFENELHASEISKRNRRYLEMNRSMRRSLIALVLMLLGSMPAWFLLGKFFSLLLLAFSGVPFVLYWLSRMLRYDFSLPVVTMITAEEETSADSSVASSSQIALGIALITAISYFLSADPMVVLKLLTSLPISDDDVRQGLMAAAAQLPSLDIFVWLLLLVLNLAAAIRVYICQADRGNLSFLKVTGNENTGLEQDALFDFLARKSSAWIIGLTFALACYIQVIVRIFSRL